MVARRGMTVLELSAAAVILLVTLTIALRYFGETSAARRALQREAVALQEAANVLERLGSLDAARAREMAGAPVPLSASGTRVLPEGTAAVTIAEPQGTPPMRRVVVRVRWVDRATRAERSVELVGWRSEEAKP